MSAFFLRKYNIRLIEGNTKMKITDNQDLIERDLDRCTITMFVPKIKKAVSVKMSKQTMLCWVLECL